VKWDEHIGLRENHIPHPADCDPQSVRPYIADKVSVHVALGHMNSATPVDKG